ncbi:MAG: flavodoxin family protein [Promethearchaeota archaeon]
MQSLLILHSYHHGNTEKIAKVFAQVLGAHIRTPQDLSPSLEELQRYQLIGFGSGIDSAKHYKPLLDLADKLPMVSSGELTPVSPREVFIFSTAAITSESKASADHKALRKKLESKGYAVVDEFQCKGFNTNSFLKYFGGMNKNRPNTEDLRNAENFARNLMKNRQWVKVAEK